jgi:transmembrane sensor
MSPLAHSDGTNYSTGLAEIRPVPFTDNTLLRMDAQTSLLVKEGGGRRTVYLATGQILVSVEHGKSEPLDVVVHGMLLRDLGTAFNVAGHDDAVTVSVTRGKIQVMELHSDGSQANPITLKGRDSSRIPTYLTPGDMARLERRDETILVTHKSNNPEEARNRTSWAEGRLKTSGQSLEDILWEINSRNKVHLLAGDPAVAQMSLGGVYDLMRVDDFLETARALGLDVAKVPEEGGTPTYILSLPPEASSAGKHRP